MSKVHPSLPVGEFCFRSEAALPDDATFEDAMERLYFLAKVEHGLSQANAGELIPHDEVEARFASDVP